VLRVRQINVYSVYGMFSVPVWLTACNFIVIVGTQCILHCRPDAIKGPTFLIDFNEHDRIKLIANLVMLATTFGGFAIWFYILRAIRAVKNELDELIVSSSGKDLEKRLKALMIKNKSPWSRYFKKDPVEQA